MTTPIYLQDVVDVLEILTDESHAYLNRQTGELYTLTDEDTGMIEDEEDVSNIPEWQKEMLVKAQDILNSDDWLMLPSKFDIHEYSIMEKFCHSINPEGIRNDLLGAIRGGGAFRRFKSAIRHYGIEEDWFRFRNDALEQIAMEWLDEQSIEYQKGQRITSG